MLTTLVDLPNATDFIASTTEWSAPLFQAFLPFIIVIVAVGLVIVFFKLITGVFRK
jgi:hypothetical protein